MDRIDALTLFLSIVDNESFVAAARRIGQSPATASRAVGELEAALGVRLIERTTRKLALTDAGIRLAEHLRRVLPDLENAMLDVAGQSAAPAGRLRISAPRLFGRMHIVPLVYAYLDTYRSTRVELNLSDRFVDLLEDGIDLALRIGRLPQSTLVARRLGAVRRVLVASPDYLKGAGVPETPEALAGHEIIAVTGQPGDVQWRFQARSAKPQTVKLKPRLQVDQMEVAIEAAAGGRGIASVLSYQVEQPLQSGKLVRILRTFEPPALPVNFVFPTARLMAPSVRAFLDLAVPRLVRLRALVEE
jgi:DNA-binding transcriptional LysR family regulator